MRRFLNIFKWFRKDESGNVTIEFVILFPLFFMVFLAIIETGILMLRQVMLDRAVEISVRDLRLGNIADITHDELKDRICRDTLVLPSCEESIRLELRPIDENTWVLPSQQAICYDKEEEINPPSDLNRGGDTELMVLRACVKFSPFFPTTGLALGLPLDGNQHYGLLSTSTFVNEPQDDGV
ncbi:TadE/TadG family type IV pilus assembly protein [Halocynthiibacter styelae]|uniref:Pilus assembly protein n=1 Tax=Halocynthiibacter styelae TaxID=2761955 RepID=A0A8J7LPG0_9RHOB|nr:TadE/TadG family type IV pilus assembly protein [Paenihalocynthiibacter styelae]MBI1493526.1 pilus assembly protein [Paenihalocynthiibacter styelae]